MLTHTHRIQCLRPAIVADLFYVDEWAYPCSPAQSQTNKMNPPPQTLAVIDT